MKSAFACLTVGVLTLVLSPPAHAQWRLDGTPIAVVPNDQSAVVMASDGAGGAIMAWVDARNGLTDIYAQRVNAAGVPLWAVDGIPMCVEGGNQEDLAIVPDGAGGVVVTWEDHRYGSSDTDIFAQRVNASGAPLWAVNGVGLCTSSSNQTLPAIASDGSGGAVVAWTDFRTDVLGDVYAQRVNGAGTPQWVANGVALCTAASFQGAIAIATDGAGGAIVTWQDFRNIDNDIYAQRVNATGVPQWTANGLTVLILFNHQNAPHIAPDGAGGAIIAWEDHRGGVGNSDVYAQRLNNAGAPLWNGGGVGVCATSNFQGSVQVASDGAGGAIMTWEDFRSGSTYDIYAQRVVAAGVPAWSANGVAVCNEPNWTQYSPAIVSDGLGGALIAWSDGRSNNVDDVFAQRLNGAGEALWTSNGVAVCSAFENQWYPAIAADGAGGAIIAWYDRRSGAGNDLYAQRVEGRYGFWGRPEPVIDAVADVPGDQGGKVKVSWDASSRDALNQQTISHYSIWRATDAAVSADAVVALSDIGHDFTGPAVRVEHTPTVDYYWELVATQSAIYLPSYSYTTATTYDSTASGSADHWFQIVAHAYYNQYVNWSSNVVSGHSVDNLAPLAPFLLTARRVGADVQLYWNRAVAPDLRDYAVYRATSSGVTPVPINFFASSDDTVAVDPNAPASALYYIVTAYDVHANQSAPSNEASVQPTTGIGDAPALTVLTVLQNYPNPFNATTDISIGLPRGSDVRIDVFDVAGRRVSAVEVNGAKAGWNRIPFAARDERGNSLASGVYFYRVKAAGSTITKKMVIAR